MEKSYCKGCGSANICKIRSIRGKKYASGECFDLFGCNDCDLVFIDIETGRHFISKYYPEDYKPHNQRSIPISNFRKPFMQKVRNFVFEKKDTRSSFVLTAVKQALFYLYNKTAYRSIPFFRGEGKLLDIGCGTGDYLLTVRDIGWSAQGVEPVEKAARQAKNTGLLVEWKSYEEVEFPEKYFDVITMWHVLEHFPDPKRVLHKVSKLLKDDGLLLVGIPNYASFDRKVFGVNWNGFEIPLHLFHYTPVSIKNLLESSGFECKKIIHTFRPSDMVSSFKNHFKFLLNSRFGKLWQTVFFFFSALISLFVSVCNRSSIIVIYAQKKTTDTK